MRAAHCRCTSRSASLTPAGGCWQHWRDSWDAWWEPTRESTATQLTAGLQKGQTAGLIQPCSAL